MIHFSTLEGLLSVLMEVIQNLHITEVEECRKFVRRTENHPHIAECQNSFDSDTGRIHVSENTK